MLSARFLIPVVLMVGHMLKPLTKPRVVAAASAVFSVQRAFNKAALSPLYTMYALIKYTNYKPLRWLFRLTIDAETRRTGFR